MNQDKIKILYVIDRIAGIYGSEKHLLELIQGLDKNVFAPVVVALNPDVAPEFEELSIPVFKFHIKKVYSLLSAIAFKNIISIIREYKFDIIETFHTTSDVIGAFLGRMNGVKVILSNRRDMGFLRKNEHDLAYPCINRMVHTIKVVCKAGADHFSERERTPREKYKVFYNGVHVEKYSKVRIDKDSLRQSLGLRSSDTVIGVVSNLKKIKGQMNLIEMAEQLSVRRNNIKYLVVGGGLKNTKNEYLEKLKRIINEKKLNNKFIFTGHRKDVPAILQILDIAVLPSLTEGCSNALLEYMASGKPVIATDVGGNPELIREGITGFLVPPNNGQRLAEKAALLIESEDLRKKMGRAGLEHVMNKFNFQRTINKETAFYSKLVGKVSSLR